MRSKNLYLYLSLLGIHILIACVAFLRFRLDPMHILFCNTGDGLKNMYTLISYVQSPITAEGIFKFNSFAYPFGDYVYYTDNTPLFAIPFRLFCHYVYDLSAYTVVVYNIFVISNIVAAGLLVYYILRRLLDGHFFAYLLAIMLPWTNIQVQRIWRGHYNLSMSCFVLSAIVLLMLWHKYRLERKKQVAVGVGMILLSLASFLAHGYYLPIITLFIAAMLFFYGWRSRSESYGKFSLGASIVYPAVAVGLSLAMIFATDKYLSLRRPTAHGYDNFEEKTRVFSFINHYDFQKISFPVTYDKPTTDSDKAAYLGNIGLFALFIIGIAALVHKGFRRKALDVQKEFFNDPVKAAILLGSLVMLSVSFGEIYYTENGTTEHGYRIVNLTNPFLYLHKFTNRVEQFRYVGRFIWPFFFGFNIWMVCTLVGVYRLSERRLQLLIAGGVLVLGGAELWDYVKALQHRTENVNYLSAENIARTTPGRLDARQYQAILPIPYYYVGSEDYEITNDDDNDWSTYTFKLQLNTGLPLMACKMSRVPPLYNKLLMDFVAYDNMDPQLRSRLNNKPILVAVSKKWATGELPWFMPHEGNQWKLYTNGLQFAARNHLQAVDSADGVIFYNYYVK